MTETRDFPTEVIASLSSGVMLVESFNQMHQAAEFLMGHEIWTHHFANKELWAEMRKTILEQCLGMPTRDDEITKENYREKRAELIAALGPTVRIRKGGGLTAMLPTDGIPDRLKDDIIHIKV
jgi:hypothetical protein